MNFFDIIKSIYSKNNSIHNIDQGLTITLLKWLSYDKKNLNILIKLIQYQMYIDPKHLYYLLFFSIPRGRPPFLKKIEKVIIKENAVYDKIGYVLQWSKRELSLNAVVLNKVIKPNIKYWKMQLGVSARSAGKKKKKK